MHDELNHQEGYACIWIQTVISTTISLKKYLFMIKNADNRYKVTSQTVPRFSKKTILYLSNALY